MLLALLELFEIKLNLCKNEDDKRRLKTCTASRIVLVSDISCRQKCSHPLPRYIELDESEG